MIRAFAARYGAHPAHLAGHLVLFGLAGWAILTVLDFREAGNWVLWFVGAALLHDLLLLPLYSAADRAGAGLLGRRRTRLLNHLRVPAAVSGVLLLVGFPLILDRAPGNFVRVAGEEPSGQLAAWLAITAGAFALSLALYAIRSVRDRQRDELEDPVAAGDGEDAGRL